MELKFMSAVKDWAKDSSSTFFAEKVLDLFFPKFCVNCNKEEGEWLCATCFAAITAPRPFYCLQPAGDGISYLDNATALFSYEENIVSKLIKLFKYNYLMEIADIFKKIINNFVIPAEAGIQTSDHWIPDQVRNDRWRGFVVIPVPLHPRRERERGFNQAEIIARIFAEKFGLDIDGGLRRGIYTTQQAKLSKEARQKNLKDAFVFDAEKTAPEKVLLVDDVFTTGATMQECAKVLKNRGVKIVCGLALAGG